MTMDILLPAGIYNGTGNGYIGPHVVHFDGVGACRLVGTTDFKAL